MLISCEDKISLRLLEWTVINYSKNMHLAINNGITDRFFIHANYKSTLSGYSKSQFDSCCRTKRIQIPYLDKLLTTTVAQMNFIRWAIVNKILDYIRANHTIIFKDMKARSKTAKNPPGDADANVSAEDKKAENKTRKRRSDSAICHTMKNFKVDNCSMTLKFTVD